jgi:hypothetical protein
VKLLARYEFSGLAMDDAKRLKVAGAAVEDEIW